MSNTDMLACCEIHKHYLKSRKWSVWSIFNKQFFFFKTVRCWVFIHVGSCIVRYLEQHLSKQPKLIHLRLIWHTGMVRERLIWQRVKSERAQAQHTHHRKVRFWIFKMASDGECIHAKQSVPTDLPASGHRWGTRHTSLPLPVCGKLCKCVNCERTY